MATYVNDLRLKEITTGDESGTWGTSTNTNLELIAEAFSYGTEVITTNADTHTTTIADGATDPGRALYLKYTGTLDSACTITIGPDTVSKVWIIENGTSGSQNIVISQGSGANITIPAGDTKVVYSDGAGAGAAFFDAFASLSVVDLKVQDDLTVTDAALVTGVLTTTATQVATGGITSGSDIISDTDSTDSLGSTGVRWLKGWFDTLTAGTLTVGSGSVTDSSGAISFGDENLTTTGIVTAAGTSVFTNLDISGDIDVDGTTNLDVVDVDGAVNFAADVTFADGADIITASAGTSNFRAGVNAGNSITSGGNYNVFVGDEAGTAITTGAGNVAVGFNALAQEDEHGLNVAIGNGALYAQNAGVNAYNTAVGYSAGFAVTTGIQNTLIGGLAGDAITTGDNSVAVGYLALSATTTASDNNAFGVNALTSNTTGTSNTGLGRSALRNNTTASNNTAVGHNALLANTTGTGNTAIGASALDTVTTGNYNIAVGEEALGAAGTGIASNVMIGYNAGSGLAGDGNVAIGHTAFDAAGDRDSCVAIGNGALTTCTTGSNNVAVGDAAMYANTTGALITAVGYLAGGANTTGVQSIYVGNQAGNYTVLNTTGNYNTMIGPFCHGTAADTTNANVIGYNVAGEGGYTTIGISGDDIRAAHGTATWATVSDERVKKDIADSTAGLSFINDLRPRTFNFKAKGDLPKEFTGYEEGSTESYKNSKTQHGFIAQEVKAVIDNHSELTEGFNLWNVRDTGQQEVAEAALIPMLVKAIQELSAEVEKLKGE
jgi:trimeric autotransporter adhesin